jgi:hypothetical protein
MFARNVSFQLKRHLLLLSVLLLGVSWAAAQNSPSQSTPTGAGSETSVQGCLGGSDGNYTLTDKSGTSFQLTGDTAKLAEHVGHEIKVTGTASSASASPSGGTAGGTMGQPSSASQQAIQVTSVKHIAKTCKSAGTPH